MGEQRKAGRPKRDEGPKMPVDEVERLLVEGELVTGDDGAEKRMWPSQREVARRFGVSPSLVATFATQHGCTERRAVFKAKLAAAKPVANKPPANKPPANKPPEEPRRRPGRPRKPDAPLVSYEELDRLLVFGEVQVLDDGTHTTVYPTYSALAERFGIAKSIVASYAKTRNCLKRREQTATRVAVRTEEKLIDLRSDALAVGEDRLVQMIDEFLLKFEGALREGRVRTDNPTDVNTLARLKAFITGGADSRQEIRNILSLEALQERYTRVMREAQEATPAMAGVIDVRAGTLRATERADTNEDPGVRNGAPGGPIGVLPPPRLTEHAVGESAKPPVLISPVDFAHLGAHVGPRGAIDPEDEG